MAAGEARQAWQDARRLREAGQLEDALIALERAAEYEGQGRLDAESLAAEAHALAQSSSEHHDLEIAQRAAEISLHLRPDVLAQRQLLADVLIRRGYGKRALGVLQRTHTSEPGVLLLRARAALLTAEPKAIEQALERLQGHATSHPDRDPTTQALLLRLRVQLRSAQGESADHKLLRQAIRLAKRSPRNHDAALALIEAALSAHRFALAEPVLKRLSPNRPRDPLVEYLHGRVKRALGAVDAAETHLRKAVALAPAYTQARLALGALLLDRGDYLQAYRVYEDAPGQAQRWVLGRLEALTGLKRFDEAARVLATIAEPWRDRPYVREATARFELARGNPRKVVKILAPLTKSEQAAAGVLCLHADALYRIGKVDPAGALYDRALGKDPDFPEALIGRARTHTRAGSARRALALLEQAEQSLRGRVRPKAVLAQLLTLRAETYLKDKRLTDARESLETALGLTLQSHAPAEAYFFRGELFAATRSRGARASYREYLRRAPKGRFAARARKALKPRKRRRR